MKFLDHENLEPYGSPGSYHIVRKSLKRVAPVCSTKHMFVNYCYKGSQASQVEL